VSHLSQLYFGRDDAESDLAEGLLKAGFLRTAAFDAALSGRKRLIIGRKGSGKSAICMTIAAATSQEYEASVVVPDEISLDELRSYELSGLASETSKSLFWRYMLATQVAKYVVAHAHSMHRKSVPSSVEILRKFLLDNGEVIDPRSHKKFWSSIQRLQSLSFGAFGASVSIGFGAPNDGLKTSSQLEAIESQVLTCLNDLACPGSHPRLVLLVDQLELVWSNDPQSDALVSGLLLASKHVARTFSGIKCVVFVRTDIYESLRLPERDKFRGDEMHLDWTPARLADMALARARASIAQDISFSELWGRVFPATINNESTANYLISLTLGRPRDLIQLANLSRDTAEKNGNATVTDRDVGEAEVQFSQWKLRDLADEYKVRYPYLADLFVLFQNSEYIFYRPEIESRIGNFQQTLHRRFPDYTADLTIDSVIEHLYEVSFLGTRRGADISYSYQDPSPVGPDDHEFHIHPCFRHALRSTQSKLNRDQAAVSQLTQPLRIALWGPPASGKSTFLSALYIAASRSQRDLLIYGADDQATEYLAQHTHMLTAQHRFPEATITPQALSWKIATVAEAPRKGRFGRRVASRTTP
jgi:energy-coupling factor transporter ATP-binding protein EcfA2